MRLLIFLILTCSTTLAFGQSKTITMAQEKAQYLHLRSGVLLVPIPEFSSNTGLNATQNIDPEAALASEKGMAILNAFTSEYHFSRVYFYRETKQNEIENANFDGLIFDENMQSIAVDSIPIERIFIAQLNDEPIALPPHVIVEKKKKKKQKKKQKTKTAKENDFQKELEKYDPSNTQKGTFIIQRHSPQLLETRKKIYYFNTPYVVILHSGLSTSTKYIRAASQMNDILNSAYRDLTEIE